MMLPQDFRPPQVRWIWVHQDDVDQFRINNPGAEYCDFAYNSDRTMSALFKVVNGG